MKIQDSVVLVTGANRGIGKAYVEALVIAGARRIYATARSIESLTEIVALAPERIVPLALDITNLEQVHAAAHQGQDVNLLINNAGVVKTGGLFLDTSVETAHLEMNTNYFGTLSMMLAFAPILKGNGGGAIANVLSVVAVANAPRSASYSASKAALHSITQCFRSQLASQGTQVIAVFPGPVDTDMGSTIPGAIAPIEVAKATLQAVEQEHEDVYPDPVSQQIFADLQVPLKAAEKQFATWMP
jgi:NAD(P)-dependent dehydrogenase (short-subunit alcohol dehydrogenase family)